jgi:hypothetical protein
MCLNSILGMNARRRAFGRTDIRELRIIGASPVQLARLLNSCAARLVKHFSVLLLLLISVSLFELFLFDVFHFERLDGSRLDLNYVRLKSLELNVNFYVVAST